MSETEEIKKRYDKRASKAVDSSTGDFYFSWHALREREFHFTKILRKKFGSDWSQLKLMEIGAGGGDNLFFFIRHGFKPENIWANELLGERFKILKHRFPGIHCVPGDASLLDKNNMFDVVLQSTVFTSILDDQFKGILARTLFNMVRPGGVVLWYDFIYNNPKNKDVKGIGKREVRALFPDASSIRFSRVTLAPPIGRKLHRMYNLINFTCPFLRTHVIAEITK